MINSIKAVISTIVNFVNSLVLVKPVINITKFKIINDFENTIENTDFDYENIWGNVAMQLNVKPIYRFETLPEFKNNYYKWN
jgi:hypothetical protein